MSTMVRQTGLAPLQAPLPVPRQYGLFSAARLTEPTDGRWTRGGWTGGDVTGPARTHDACASGTERLKHAPGPIATQMEGAFTVYLPGFCTTATVGPDPTWFTDRLELVFQAVEEQAVERVMATGDGHATLGHYLADTNATILGSGSQTPLRALELLEGEIARVGGGGILHAAPQVATAWDALNVTENVRGTKRTMLGTPIAVGAGYEGATPDGQSAAAVDEEWAFASGPVEVLRSADVSLIPTGYAQAIDRTVNDVEFLAERPYLISWIARQDTNDDGHIQAAVLVDLTTLTS